MTSPNKNKGTYQQIRSVDYVTNFPEITAIFDVLQKKGEGSFSSVTLVRHKSQNGEDSSKNKVFAMKMIIPTIGVRRIENEMRIMKVLGGRCNIIQLYSAMRVRDHIFLLMPYFEHEKFSSYFLNMDEAEIRFYIQNLLEALAHLHRHGVVHRDVKPANFLYDRRHRRFALVDFGLAQLEGNRNVGAAWEKEIEQMRDGTLVEAGSSSSLQQQDKENCDSTGHTTTPVRRVSSSSALSSSSPRLRENSLKVLTPLNASGHAAPSSLRAAREEAQFKTPLPHRGLHTATLLKPVSGQVGSSLRRRRTLASPGVCGDVNSSSTPVSKLCHCSNQGPPVVTCAICRHRPPVGMQAPGTLGYRPPEVMWRCAAPAAQSGTIDVWAVGVILLNFITARLPFFQVKTDCEVTHCLLFLLGMERVRAAARVCGWNLVADPVPPPLPLLLDTEDKEDPFRAHGEPEFRAFRKQCTHIRAHNERLSNRNNAQVTLNKDYEFQLETYELLYRLVDPNYQTRITASDALNHDYFTRYKDI